VPDLQLAAQTDDPLVNAYLWLRDERINSRLREAASVSLRAQLHALHDQAAALLSHRDLGDGITMVGELFNVQVDGVHSTPEAVIARATANGVLTLYLPVLRLTPGS